MLIIVKAAGNLKRYSHTADPSNRYPSELLNFPVIFQCIYRVSVETRV